MGNIVIVVNSRIPQELVIMVYLSAMLSLHIFLCQVAGFTLFLYLLLNLHFSLLILSLSLTSYPYMLAPSYNTSTKWKNSPNQLNCSSYSWPSHLLLNKYKVILIQMQSSSSSSTTSFLFLLCIHLLIYILNYTFSVLDLFLCFCPLSVCCNDFSS